MKDIQNWAEVLEGTNAKTLELAECSRLLYGLTRPLLVSKHIKPQHRETVARLKRSSAVIDQLLVERGTSLFRRYIEATHGYKVAFSSCSWKNSPSSTRHASCSEDQDSGKKRLTSRPALLSINKTSGSTMR